MWWKFYDVSCVEIRFDFSRELEFWQDAQTMHKFGGDAELPEPEDDDDEPALGPGHNTNKGSGVVSTSFILQRPRTSDWE